MAKIATEFLQLDPKDQSMADFRTTLSRQKIPPGMEHRNMVLDTRNQEPLRLGRGGVQRAAQPHTMKASVAGFENTVLAAATGKRDATRILKI